MWSEAEVEQAWVEWRRKSKLHKPETALSDAMRRVMTLAVELAAARGETMSAEELREADLRSDHGCHPKLFEHIAAQGARVAALEQERDTFRSSWHEARASAETWRAEVEEQRKRAEQAQSALVAIRERALSARAHAENEMAGFSLAMRWVLNGDAPPDTSKAEGDTSGATGPCFACDVGFRPTE